MAVESTKMSTAQVVLVVLLTLAVVALVGYARGEPGDDGRASEPQELHVYVEME